MNIVYKLLLWPVYWLCFGVLRFMNGKNVREMYCDLSWEYIQMYTMEMYACMPYTGAARVYSKEMHPRFHFYNFSMFRQGNVRRPMGWWARLDPTEVLSMVWFGIRRGYVKVNSPGIFMLKSMIIDSWYTVPLDDLEFSTKFVLESNPVSGNLNFNNRPDLIGAFCRLNLLTLYKAFKDYS